MSKVRTRFAPSPTGRMHVGNLRTALYAYLITKHEGGDFLLRIEDTDQERLVEGAVDIIYRTLEKTGLIHDEGPDKDGGVGPYVQSERQASGIYLEYAKQLVEKGEAYYCFCDKERLESLKQEVAGKEINLSFKEYSLLMVLLEAEGNVVSRDALLTRVWGEFYDESRTLDVHIRKLRMKLETAGKLIHTVKNIGYKLGGNENG